MTRQLLHRKNFRNSRNSIEKYIGSFLPSLSIDDGQKFDLYVNKNSKYLF